MLAVSDGEFHRHWQEIAINLPIHEWYVSSDLNRALCFMDYPIMTQYFHLFMAQVFTKPLVPQAVRLSTIWNPTIPLYGPFDEIYPEAVDEYISTKGVKVYPFQISLNYETFKYDFV